MKLLHLSLLALVLCGCAQSVTVVDVSINYGQKDVCVLYENIVDGRGIPVPIVNGFIPQDAITRCVIKGDRLDCGTGDCIKKEKKADIRSLEMSPEEFQFKYNHDPAFKASVESYSFRQE